MSHRSLRAQRKVVVESKRGHEALEALTEDAEELGLYEDSPFPLPNGTQVDPRAQWVMPSNEQPTKEN